MGVLLAKVVVADFTTQGLLESKKYQILKNRSRNGVRFITVASNYLIALDDGHGMETAGKRTPIVSEIGRAIKENEFNKSVVRLIDEQLRFIGFRTLLVAPTDKNTSLVARTNLANSKSADVYCSIHYDAMGSTWGTVEGHTIFVYPGNLNKQSGKLAACIAEYLKQGTNQKWRGIKEADFHVLRETKMPAILSENGFMDNPREAKLMLDENFQNEVAKEHVQGICKYLGVTYKEKKEETVVSNEIQLTENQQKDKDVLVRRGYMAKDFKVLSGEMVALITMQAALVRELEKNGALK